MVNYGIVKSTVRPQPIVFDAFSVWEHSNIKPITETIGEEIFAGFQYTMIQYGKDEYLKLLVEQKNGLDTQVTDLQLALIELYEGKVV